jgi:hypothetical protein
MHSGKAQFGGDEQKMQLGLGGHFRPRLIATQEQFAQLYPKAVQIQAKLNSPGAGGGRAGEAGSAERLWKAAMEARLCASLADRAPSSGDRNSTPLTATVARKSGTWSGPSRVSLNTGGAHRRCWHSSCSRDLCISA